MRRLLPLLLLVSCGQCQRDAPVVPMVLCAEDAPTDYAAWVLPEAAADWGCVRLAESDCDRRLLWNERLTSSKQHDARMRFPSFLWWKIRFL